MTTDIHTADCVWERTTSAECGYRDTHHFCPHLEHACTCSIFNPTEEEAEAILREHGTSGKEVTNRFIERLLRERSEMKAELDRLRTTKPPVDPVVVREAAKEIAEDLINPILSRNQRPLRDFEIEEIVAIITRHFAATPLPETPVGDGWLPIETAPRDGRRILLWCVHPNAQHSKDARAEGWEAAVIGEWTEHNGGGWVWHGLAGTHTHWMPLPAAPFAPVAASADNEGEAT